MEASIKDKDKLVGAGLRAIGFKMKQKHVEIILNISDYIRDNPDATLKDILRKEQCVLSLYGEDELSNNED